MATSIFKSMWILAACGLVWTSAGQAQTAFAPLNPAPAASEAAPPDAAAAPAKPKPKPVPMVILTNASASTATEVVVSSGDMTARLDKPLPSKAKASLRLPKLKGCIIALAASFESGGQVEIGGVNICKDKSIRFTE